MRPLSRQLISSPLFLWHFIANTDGSRLSFYDDRFSFYPQNPLPTISPLQTSRHFLGWAPNVSYNIGMFHHELVVDDVSLIADPIWALPSKLFYWLVQPWRCWIWLCPGKIYPLGRSPTPSPPAPSCPWATRISRLSSKERRHILTLSMLSRALLLSCMMSKTTEHGCRQRPACAAPSGACVASA